MRQNRTPRLEQCLPLRCGRTEHLKADMKPWGTMLLPIYSPIPFPESSAAWILRQATMVGMEGRGGQPWTAHRRSHRTLWHLAQALPSSLLLSRRREASCCPGACPVPAHCRDRASCCLEHRFRWRAQDRLGCSRLPFPFVFKKRRRRW